MKNYIENFLLRHLFNAITVDEIVANDTKTKAIVIDGKPLTINEINQIQAEIKALEGFRIWKLLTNTPKHHAEDRIYNKSVSMDDIRYGKAMLYALGLQSSIIEALRKKDS